MDRALVDALARDLAAASYTDGGVAALIGDEARASLTRMLAQPARRAAHRRSGALSTLLRAFWLGDEVAEHEMADALPALGVDGAVALGIAEHRGARLAPLLAIRPHPFRDAHGSGEWWIVSDLDELAGALPLRPDHVLGVGGAARTLAALLPPVRAASALDLGTGCGVIALHLRRFADHVVATDISERALRCTELTAALNGIDGIETRLGDRFAPVSGEQFDLIASNPPFVITPRAEGVPEYEYPDGGAAGDELMASVVGGIATHLRPGGHARLLGNWETIGDVDGLERVRGWTDRGPLDAWAIERESLDPVRYAELWLRDGGMVPRDDAHARLLDAWIDDFEARGVRSIGMGWLAMHRDPDGTPGRAAALTRFERVPQAVQLDRVAEHLVDAIDDAAWLAGIDDEALASERLVVAPDVTEARHQLPGAAGPTVIELRQGGALGRTVSVDTALAGLVGACDGELAIGPLIDAIASLLEVDAVILSADLLPRVRELVVTGLLRRLSD